MRQRPFKQVDVFTAVPYRGNPLAVVLDGRGLSTEAMQHFTHWTHLSEATFLLPPTQSGADYRVRIFCPGRELPFAGHPTLGSCHAWLQAGGSPQGEFVVQEGGVGLVRIRRDGERLAFAAPPLQRSGPLAEADVARIARGLGVERRDIVQHAWCNNGPEWRGVLLKSAEQVLSLRPDAAILSGLFVGVVGPHQAGHECAFEVRAFFPGHSGLVEDPVTGSLNAALAPWLIGAGLAPERYLASLDTLLSTIGLTVLDYPTRQRLLFNGGSSRLASGLDKLVLALSKAKGWFFPAWRGAATDPVVMAAGRAKDLARRSAYRVGQPVDGKPWAAQEVLPHPPDPGPRAKSQRPRPLPAALGANRQRPRGAGTDRTGGPALGRPRSAGGG